MEKEPSKNIKLLINKLSSKDGTKQIMDETTSELLVNCCIVIKFYIGNINEAEKMMKDMIKGIVQVAILCRNNQFTKDEFAGVEKFRYDIKIIAKALISFYQVDFTFNPEYLLDMYANAYKTLDQFGKNHLTGKTMKRIEHFYSFCSDQNF